MSIHQVKSKLTRIDLIESGIINRIEDMFSNYPTWSRQPAAEYDVVRSIGQIVREELNKHLNDHDKKVACSLKRADNI